MDEVEHTVEANGIVATYVETETERILAFDVSGRSPNRRDSGVASGDHEETESPGEAGGRGQTDERPQTDGRGTVSVAQNLDGYAMVKVRSTSHGGELERYYGFEMALDHAAEVLGVSPHELPIPAAADDMGM